MPTVLYAETYKQACESPNGGHTLYYFTRDGRVGYVDVIYVFDNYYKTSDFDKTFKKINEANHNNRQDEVDRLFLQLELDGIKPSHKSDIKEKFKEVRNNFVKGVYDDIEKACELIGKEYGYARIVNIKCGESGQDLTHFVLNILNNTQKEKPSEVQQKPSSKAKMLD